MNTTPSDDRGFVLAATGATYRRLACKAAASLRAHHPDLPIDLFTDAPLSDGPFSQVHLLPAQGPAAAARPRFHAMREARFARALHLDADLLAVASVADIFTLLDRFDLALAQDQWPNSVPARRVRPGAAPDIPDAFPQLNGGVIGLRASPLTRAFIDRWDAAYTEDGSGYDQPALRDILWHDRTLRVAILPPEYNLWDYRRIGAMDHRHIAPRILHSNLFARPRVLARAGDEIAVAIGHARAERLAMLRDSDLGLGAAGRHGGFTPARRARWALAALRDLPRKVRAALGRPYP